MVFEEDAVRKLATLVEEEIKSRDPNEKLSETLEKIKKKAIERQLMDPNEPALSEEIFASQTRDQGRRI